MDLNDRLLKTHTHSTAETSQCKYTQQETILTFTYLNI